MYLKGIFYWLTLASHSTLETYCVDSQATSYGATGVARA